MPSIPSFLPKILTLQWLQRACSLLVFCQPPDHYSTSLSLEDVSVFGELVESPVRTIAHAPDLVGDFTRCSFTAQFGERLDELVV